MSTFNPQPKTFRVPSVPKRIPRKSPRTAARDRRYAAERVEFLSEHLLCQAALPHICTGRAFEVHHMAGRGRSVFFDQSLWRALCSACHTHLAANPQEAIDRGLSQRRNGIR